MAITDLSSFTSKLGVTTNVWRHDEAETIVLQHEFMHLSFYKDDLYYSVNSVLERARACNQKNQTVSSSISIFSK